MKKLSLLSLLTVIYLLSSSTGFLVVDPRTWAGMKTHYFSIDFSNVFNIHSGFYSLYFLNIHDADLMAHKTCHFLFFGTLSLLFLWNLKKVKHAYKFAWLLTALWGLLDEIHQFSVPGRTGTIQDVGVDSVSALIWLVSFYAITKLSHLAKEKVAINLKQETV